MRAPSAPLSRTIRSGPRRGYSFLPWEPELVLSNVSTAARRHRGLRYKNSAWDDSDRETRALAGSASHAR
jgi:hypothetical protein